MNISLFFCTFKNAFKKKDLEYYDILDVLQRYVIIDVIEGYVIVDVIERYVIINVIKIYIDYALF